MKDRETEWRRWNGRSLAPRFVRNVHPCNYFLLPNEGWQRWGAEQRRVAFFASIHRERYHTIWTEFLQMAGSDDAAALVKVSGAVRFTIAPSDPSLKSPSGILSKDEPPIQTS